MTADNTHLDPAVAAPAVVRTAVVNRSPEDAFTIFTDEIGAWWPLPTHGVFGARSGGLRFHDGHLIETAVDGAETVWADVVDWEPPVRFGLDWRPGSVDGPASRVDISFEPEGAGTRVVIRHHGWEAFGDDGIARRRRLVGPSAWGYVLDHFADGAEPIDDAVDVTGLAATYAAFFDEAAGGGFHAPPAGEWSAEQVVAHVALNDLAMTAVTQAIIHAGEPHFENHTCQDAGHLAAVIDRCGDMDGLIGFGRACARDVMAALRRLRTEQQSQRVPCRLEHDGQVVVEAEHPWVAIAVHVQADRHLPAHIEQLANLRDDERSRRGSEVMM
jgi:hypothetical protein